MRRAALALCALLAGCRPQATELVLVVDEAVPPDEELSHLDVVVWSDRAPIVERRVPIAELPHVQVLVPSVGDTGEVSVAIAGWSESFLSYGPVRHARTRFDPGHARLLHLTLLRCSGLCAIDEACTERGCAPIDVAPEALPLYESVPSEPSVPLGCEVVGGPTDACDGLDDDCDGVVDEAGELDAPADLEGDPLHCGACGHACAGACNSGVCEGEAALAITSGAGHVCAARADGSVACWGWNELGQLGAEDASARAGAVSGLGAIASWASGTAHTCAVGEDGGLACWGDGYEGQVGVQDGLPHPTPLRVAGVDGVQAVATGAAHTCALVGTGEVLCFGANERGQLGRGEVGPASIVPTAVGGLGAVVAMGAGAFHTCAIDERGTWCWGAGDDGQLGSPGASDSAVPVLVPGVDGATAVAGGRRHTCVLQAGGATCWGDDSRGQLGRGAVGSSPDPAPVAGLSGAAALSAAVSGEHTCALLAPSGRLACWGAGTGYQLGDGVAEDRASPVTVPGLEALRAVATGGSARGDGHTCAIDGAGAVLCWGDNGLGQLGQSGVFRQPEPARVRLP